MKLYKDEAYIIKIVELKEADKLVILLSKRHGIIETVAKSGGKPLTRKSSSLDLGNKLDAAIYPAKGFDILREVILIDDLQFLKQDYDSIMALMGILELIQAVSLVGEADADMYAEFEELLMLLRHSPQKRDLLLRAFEIKLLYINGFGPELDICVECGTEHKPDVVRTSSFTNHLGYQCLKHTNNQTPVVNTLLKVQKFIKANSLRSVLALAVDDKILKQMYVIHTIWLENILEKKLNSRKLSN